MKTREELFKTMNEIFKNVFDDDSIVIGESTTADDIEDWDSLEHINLVVTIEKCFQVKFTMSEVTDSKNVGEMVDIIFNKQLK